MRALGFEPKKEEVRKLIQEIDQHNKGFIEKSDFMSVMSVKIVIY